MGAGTEAVAETGGRGVVQESGDAAEDVAPESEAVEDLGVVAIEILRSELDGVAMNA